MIGQMIPRATAPFILEGRGSEAECTKYDPDLMYPYHYRRDTDQVRTARRVCWDCPLRIECATFAIKTREPQGIWGGLLPNERVALIALRPHELARILA